MTEVILEFEIAEGGSGDAMAEKLKARLAAIDDVEDVVTKVDRPRGIAEAITIVAASVVLIDQGTAAAVSLKNFAKALKELMQEGEDFYRAVIEVRGRRIDLATVTDEEVERL
jgi:hypothetical protein